MPTALTPWAAELSALTDELSITLGPWLGGISGLLAEQDTALAGQGEPVGYDGLTGRGTPERLLASEWLLASEEPAEFLRRAITGELLYLAPARHEPAPRGRVAVLVDCGPAQWGPARLAQLAVLLVLHRRAASAGIPLVVGVLGTPARQWRGGELESVLRYWQGARQLSTPDTAEVDRWLDGGAADDEVWLIGGPASTSTTPTIPPTPARPASNPAAAPARISRLTITEAGWDSTGVTALAVTLDGRTCVLAMPAAAPAVQALRGYGFRRQGAAPAALPADALLRYPVFPSMSQTIIGRGPDDRTVISVRLPHGRPRQHAFGAPVIGAGLSGKRLIVLLLHGSQLRVQIIGRPLPAWEKGAWLAGNIDGSALADAPLAPVHLTNDGHGLLTRLADTWWRLVVSRGAPIEAGITAAAAAPGTQRLRAASATREVTMSVANGVRLTPGEQLVFGPPPHHCTSMDGRLWTTTTRRTLTLPEHDQLIGVTTLRSELVLVTRSAGQILRLVTPDQIHTLTRWSTGIGEPALHPSLPWLAVTRSDGAVTVVNLGTDDVVCTLAGSA